MSSFVVDEHFGYLADTHRMNAYRSALNALVRPGSVVVDLGSGSGILGLLACEAGAARVYCIDDGAMIDVARAHIAASGYADRCVMLKAHSEQVRLPELADLVVADQMGPFGVGAGLVEYFADARRRFLKPTGVLVPGRLSLWLAGVADAGFRERLRAVERNAGALDVSHLRHLSLNSAHYVNPSETRQDFLTAPQEFVNLTLGTDPAPKLTATVEFTATATGALDGLAGWFSASLDAAARTELTNAPLAAQRVDRHCLFIPFNAPLPVHEGDVLRVALTTLPRQMFLAWHVQRVDASGACVTLVKQTSLPSQLLSREHLLRTCGTRRPVLSRRGLLKRYILELCDEQRTLDQIVDAVHERYGDDTFSRDRSSELVIGTLSELTQ